MRGRGNINYIYDAAGNKLCKITADSTVSAVKTTTTVYTSLFVYQNDSLQYIAHEEGRIRPKLISQTGGWVATNLQYLYDYVVKDHLGNERMTLTEETQTDTYAATMETKNAATENALFDSVSSTQYAVPAGFEPASGADTSNHYVSRLNSNNKRVGPTLLLKVMAGDTLTAASYVWYVGTPQSPGTQPSLLSTLTNLLADNVLGIAGSKFLAGQQSAISTAAGPAFTSLLAAKDAAYSGTAPKAFLNWAFLDERFNYVQGGVTQVPLITAGQSKQIITAALPSVVAKSGYFYVYVSNESPQDVFFDNVTIQHKRGPLLQEDHYYPFGLTMAGIGGKAVGGLENKLKFNGKELNNKEFFDGNGLDWYEMGFRTDDPQLGRFIQIDPIANKYPKNSPYAYAENRVPTGLDLEGLEFIFPMFEASPMWNNLALESNNMVARPVVETVVKATAEVGSKAAEEGKGPLIEEHHIIPKELKNNPVIQSARKGGFKFEGKENKISLEKFQNATGQGRHGNHPNYTSEVAQRLAKFHEDNPNATPQQATEFLRAMVKDLQSEINNSPQKLNSLFKTGAQMPAIDNTNVDNSKRKPLNTPTKIM